MNFPLARDVAPAAAPPCSAAELGRAMVALHAAHVRLAARPRAEVLASLHRGGDSIADLARWYNLSEADVRAAITYEEALAA